MSEPTMPDSTIRCASCGSRLGHTAIEELTIDEAIRRAKEAEAGAAAMRVALATALRLLTEAAPVHDHEARLAWIVYAEKANAALTSTAGRALLEERDRLRGALRWTRERPTVAGWYWWRWADGETEVVEVLKSARRLVVRERLPVERYRTELVEWAGPVAVPEESALSPACEGVPACPVCGGLMGRLSGTPGTAPLECLEHPEHTALPMPEEPTP